MFMFWRQPASQRTANQKRGYSVPLRRASFQTWHANVIPLTLTSHEIFTINSKPQQLYALFICNFYYDRKWFILVRLGSQKEYTNSKTSGAYEYWKEML